MKPSTAKFTTRFITHAVIPLCIILPLIFLSSSAVMAQNNPPARTNVIVSGRVTNAKGEPFQGVSIKVKGSNRGAVTNADGRFTIAVSNGKATLTFSHVGFGEQEISVNDRRSLDVVMNEQASSLNDVIVVAYGKQKQITVTGAVSTVAGKELVSTSVANISNMLVGNAPGLSGLQTSGEPWS